MPERPNPAPCTCREHETGAVVDVGAHHYQLHEDERGWRWMCSCGRRGRFTRQSPNVPYHSWVDHVEKGSRDE